MEHLKEILEISFLGNPVGSWLLATAVFCATFLVVPLIHGRIRAHQARWRHVENPAVELMSRLAARTSRLVLLSVALYVSQKLLDLPAQVDRVLNVVIVFGVAVQGALWAVTALRFAIERHYAKGGSTDAGSRASVGVIMFLGQLVIWAIFVLLALDNLGVNITALVAGMGIGGIAIALAVQTILGDLLGSMSIALDKPFVVGDSLRIDDIEGTVENIGIKSTRLRSVTGEQIILSNADVLKSRVRNMGRMPERRASFRLRFPYDTAHEDLARISKLVEEAVTSVPNTRFVSCLLAAIGDYALEFEVIYFTENIDGRIPLVTDAVNRGILERLGAAGISLTYPTQRALSVPPPDRATRDAAPV